MLGNKYRLPSVAEAPPGPCCERVSRAPWDSADVVHAGSPLENRLSPVASQTLHLHLNPCLGRDSISYFPSWVSAPLDGRIQSSQKMLTRNGTCSIFA